VVAGAASSVAAGAASSVFVSVAAGAGVSDFVAAAFPHPASVDPTINKLSITLTSLFFIKKHTS